MPESPTARRDYALNLVYLALLKAALALPYRWRVPLMGWFGRAVLGPVAGYRRRVRENLALAWPELDAAAVERIATGAADNFGRGLIELYSGADFTRRAAALAPEGPGVAPFREARRTGRPVIFVTAHFGNFDAVRAWLFAHGHPIGALYAVQENRYFNAHYVAALSEIGRPMFPRTREGLVQMVRHLKSGGLLGVVADQHVYRGARLRFFGQPAMTTLSPAEMALKYDALLLPVYGIRAEDGLGFRLIFDAPIPHGDAEAMSQALNDNLESWVRRYPEQWFWFHRRWKAAVTYTDRR